MKKSVVFLIPFLLTVILTNVAFAGDGVVVRPFAARTFAIMPEIADFPEGITANPYNGDIFVSTFERFKMTRHSMLLVD